MKIVSIVKLAFVVVLLFGIVSSEEDHEAHHFLDETLESLEHTCEHTLTASESEHVEVSEDFVQCIMDKVIESLYHASPVFTENDHEHEDHEGEEDHDHDEDHDDEHDDEHEDEHGHATMCLNATDLFEHLNTTSMHLDELPSLSPWILYLALDTNCTRVVHNFEHLDHHHDHEEEGGNGTSIVDILSEALENGHEHEDHDHIHDEEEEEEEEGHHDHDEDIDIDDFLHELYDAFGVEKVKQLPVDEEYLGHHAEDDHDHDHEVLESEAHDHDEESPCLTLTSMNHTLHETNETEHVHQIEVISTVFLSMIVSEQCFTVMASDNHERYTQVLFSSFAGADDVVSYNEIESFYEFIGLISNGTDIASSTEDDHDDHDGHNHRRRDVDEPLECLDIDELVSTFGYILPLNQQEFISVVPAVVAMLDAGCNYTIAANQTDDAPLESTSGPSNAEKWGYAILATVIVSAASLIGFFLIVCRKSETDDDSYASRVQSLDKRLVIAFTALAISSLLADSLFHIIPQVLGVHSHDGHDHDHSDEEESYDFLWKAIVIFVGVYMFFIVELIMARFLTHDHHHSHHRSPDHRYEDTKETKMVDVVDVDQVLKKKAVDEDTEACKHVHHHVSQHETHIKPQVAWLILVGDGLHNLVDGLAIGAAFSISTTSGLSTALAVFCHEAPHEIGDLAVLLDAGWPMCKALLANFLSALTAVVGAVIGVAASTTGEFQMWVLALTAGMFLYLSLTGLLPEAAEQINRAKTTTEMWLRVFAWHLGFWAGFAIMVLIARYEHNIQV